ELEPDVNWNQPLVIGLTSAWGPVPEWFTNNILKPVVDWFTPLVEGLKTAWSDVTSWVSENVIQVIVDWVWGSGGGAPPVTGADGIPTNPTNPDLPIDVSPGLPYMPPESFTGQSLRPPAMAGAGGGNVIINGPILQQPLDMVMLANQVARMIRQGRV
ncbi:MAG: hypothetical protein ACRC1H_14930, partial [Caldilineaceae bacterium]